MIKLIGGICEFPDFTLRINDLTIGEGLLFIEGPNGAGKSTLLKILLGIIELTRGEIRRDDSNVYGYLPQNYRASLMPWLKAEANLYLHANKANQRRELLSDLADIGFRDLDLHKFPHALSGGQCQRLAITRECYKAKDLLVLDEPFSGLDKNTVSVIGEKIRKIVDKNVPVLLTSHTKLPSSLCDGLDYNSLTLERISDNEVELKN